MNGIEVVITRSSVTMGGLTLGSVQVQNFPAGIGVGEMPNGLGCAIHVGDAPREPFPGDGAVFDNVSAIVARTFGSR